MRSREQRRPAREVARESQAAIVGMACRFPLANDYREFWNNLVLGRDCIQEIPSSRWDTRQYYSPEIDHPGTSVSRWCGLVSGVERFDNRFFEISPREAKNMDPQQRLLLEETLHCVEDSGIPLAELRAKRTSVFAGVMASDYHQEAVHPSVQPDSFAGTGNYACILANRVSYVFGFQGKSFTIDAACASSLVALHEARCALQRGESDYAIVAGVSLNLHPWKYVTWSKSRMLSPDGRCKTFDKDANGYVPGDGVGVLLLQRSSEAQRDRNRIYALVTGSAVNHGGRAASMTAPRIDAQKDVILSAIESAGISARTIGYVEAHGTGTSLGDPIEVEALTRAFRCSTADSQFARIGSCKTNIGHLEAAAGVAGVIKVLLMMRHGLTPRTLNVTTLNPIIDFPQTPFTVALENSEWPRFEPRQPRRAGVSSFGIGGVNSHVILEEHLAWEDAEPRPEQGSQRSGRKHLFLLSARSPGSFARRLDQWREWLRRGEGNHEDLGDVCKTNAVSSGHYPLRRGVIIESIEDLDAFLEAAPAAVSSGTAPSTLLLRHHLFAGFRSVRSLYEENALFRQRVDALLRECKVPGLRSELGPAFRSASWPQKARKSFSCLVGHAFWATLGDLGFSPQELYGEEQGFVVALALSGMLEPVEALALASGEAAGMVRMRAPNVSLFDPVRKVLIPSLSIGPEYLEHLSQGLQLSDSEFSASIGRARLLLPGQRTFQRFLEEWNDALAPLGLTVERFLQDERRTAGSQGARARLLLFVAVESAFRKLGSKWSFQSRPLAQDERLVELVKLVADGLLPRTVAVELLLSDTPDLMKLAQAAQSAITSSRRQERYPLLDRFSRPPGDERWLQAAMQASLGDGPTPGPLLFEGFSAGAREESHLQALFERTLLELWERGTPIQWERLHPTGSYGKVALPAYPFEGEAFWIREKTAVEASEAPRVQLMLSPSDPIIRDHVVGGRHLIPGALMVGLSLRGARNAGHGERSSLRNIVFHTPGIVNQSAGLRVELDGEVVRVSVDDIPVSQAQVAQEGAAHPGAGVASRADAALQPHDVDALYEGLAASGFQYGESLRLLQRFDSSEALCLAELSAERLREQGDGLVPHLVDAVLQAGLLTGYVGGHLSFGRDRFVPSFIGAMRFFGVLPPVLRLQITRKPAARSHHRFSVEVTGHDLSGRRVLELEDVVYQRADGAQEARRQQGWEMQVPYWRESSLPVPGASASDARVAVIGAVGRYASSFIDCARQAHGRVQEAVSGGGDLSSLIETITAAPGRATLYFLDALEDDGLAGAERALHTLLLLVKTHLLRASDRELRIMVPVRNAFIATEADRGGGFPAAALLGLAKTAMLENPRLQVSLVDVGSFDEAGMEALLREGAAPGRAEDLIAYRQGRRLVREMRTLPAGQGEAVRLFASGKNYLLAGGGGGIGSAIINALAAQVACRVFVLGRSARASEEDAARHQCEVHYLRCDMTDRAQVERAVRQLTTDFGPLHGVLHLGGVLHDKLLRAKSWEEFRRVLAPKLEGTLHLHEATREQPLDFFIGFSSIVSLTGNVGQADYAAGNNFLDAFMAFRARSGAPGRSLVVNWPLWEGVGMASRLAEGRAVDIRHLRPIRVEEGVQALEAVLAQREAVQVFVQGSRHAEEERPRPAASGKVQNVESYLRELIATRLGLPGPDFDATESFFTMGLDSLILQEMMAELNRSFKELPPTLMFEHPNLRKLVAYFEKEGLTGPAEPAAPMEKEEPKSIAPPAPSRIASVRKGYDIAIIGMSGRFPQARTVRDFWRNLIEGKDCITEIPADRWDAHAILGSRSDTGARSYGRWGGFIEEVDRFDPLFFNISPKEAEEMDPQQRLFLECVWETMEDAGYAARQRYQDKSVGLFVGVMWNEYSQLAHEKGLLQGDYKGPGSLYWAIANRASFFMDFKGPSLAIDTACSSSLVAIHLACQSILSGECDMAVAGGVNLSIHPGKYVYLSQAKFLSSDGRCRSFGVGGDGYVPGEGLGAVLLKPLEAALADGDQIHAVIRGSASNHGGKAAGFTVPNPDQQARLIQKALERAAVRPEDINYVECHGTGTALGDPIEIRGLQLAFGQQRGRERACPIGSVKSNIGHLEAAAGIAAVIKVALAMRHQVIPRSLHGDVENPKLELGQTPFYVVKQTQDWSVGPGHTRIAAISSFGAGGSNAHLLLEEFPAARVASMASTASRAEPHVFVLSARDSQRLAEQVARLRAFLESAEAKQLALADIAHTLQVGRHAFNERLAVVASSLEELREALASYPHDEALRADARYGELSRLAAEWQQGGSVDWARLATGPRRIVSLPTYSFRRERYWISGAPLSPGPLKRSLSGAEPLLEDHVLLGKKTLPGAYVLAKVLSTEGLVAPGRRARRIAGAVWMRPLVVHRSVGIELEIARTADKVRFALWAAGTDSERLCYAEGAVSAEAERGRLPETRHVDLSAVRLRCPLVKRGEVCYEAFGSVGLQYGERFQVIEQVHLGKREALSRLGAARVSQGEDRLVSILDGALQTALALLLDSEGVVGSAYVPFSLGELEVLGDMGAQVSAHVRMIMPARAEAKGGFRFDIDLCDDSGAVVLAMREVFLGRMAALDVKAEPGTGPYFYRPEWREAPLPVPRSLRMGDVLVLGAEDALVTELRAKLAEEQRGARLFSVGLRRTAQPHGGGGYSVDVDDPASYDALVQALGSEGARPTRILHVAALRHRAEASASLEEQIAGSGLSLLFLFQALMKEKAATHVSLVYAYPTGTWESPVLAAPSGLLRTMAREKTDFACASVGLEIAPVREMAAVLWRELERVSPGCAEIAYSGGHRLGRSWLSLEGAPTKGAMPALRRGGVYLITGGAGGLGLLFAEHLIRQYDARVVLTGRSVLDPQKQTQLSRLGGAERVAYLQGDVSQRDEVVSWVRSAREHFGALHGVLHSAGARRDSYLIRKTRQEVDEVLRPKLLGAMHLDEATRHEPLDCFVLFSSVSAVFGNAGQGDYAYANAFLDAFAWQREELRARGLRAGQTLSLDWPLWRDGGMKVDPASEALLARTMGMRPLLRGEGLEAFERALTFREQQLMVIAGNKEKIDSLLGSQEPTRSAEAPEVDTASLLDKVRAEAVVIMSRLLKVDRRDIHLSEDLREYGFDSITFTQFANALNEHFGLELTPAVFFEHSTLASLTEYVAGLQGTSDAGRQAPPIEVRRAPSMTGPRSEPAVERESRVERKSRVERVEPISEDIAIIGIAGVMPQSENLERFWKHLEAGEELVTPIPEQRWNWWKVFRDTAPGVLEAMRGKRAGFISHPEHFDAALFGISPREADFMDPQQRVFMEMLWKAVEDSGYRLSDLWGARVGLFVGVATSDYAELLRAQNAPIDALTATGVFHSILVNRISYLFNFTGPSEPVDTACSSSLVAVQRAVTALRSGQCELAIAGGVNLLLAPTLFLSFEKAGMLSPEGSCKTFDKDANGYVRGEGSAAVVLKPLRKALADGDHVYGIVRSAVVGHAGRANSLTAPNPNAQAELLVRAYREAGISPARVSYIEAHGTGTSLGDPIEVNALKKAFQQLLEEQGATPPAIARCALGAVKTNIGHLEAAAGIAGLVKVLLAMKHRKIPANASFRERNPYVELDGSPFYLPRSLEAWESPHGPRVAGVSSFGFGGVNAHVVVEEHVATPEDRAEAAEPVVFILSAKTEAALRQYAADMLQHLEAPGLAASLRDIAYTTQVGREAMTFRLGVLAVSREELLSKLRAYLARAKDTEGLFEGRKAEHEAAMGLLIEGEEGKLYLRMLAQNGKLQKLCQLWTLGVEVDWRLLHEGKRRRRVSLPTYPFAKEVHWHDQHALKGEVAIHVEAPPRPVGQGATQVATPVKPNGVEQVATSRAAPVTSNGARPAKLTLKAPGSNGQVKSELKAENSAKRELVPAMSKEPEPIERLRSLLARILFVETSAIGLNEPLAELGLDPVLADEFLRKVSEDFGISLGVGNFQGQQTLAELAGSLTKMPPAGAQAEQPQALHPEPPPADRSTLEVTNELRTLLADVLFTGLEQLEASRPLAELGLDSVLGLEFIDKVNQRFNIKVSPSKLYEHPSLERLGDYVAQVASSVTPQAQRTEKRLLFAVSEPSAIGLSSHALGRDE